MKSVLNQKGIGGAMLMVIGVALVFAAVMAKSMMSGSSDSNEESAKIEASGVLGQANNIHSAIERAVSRGTTYADLTFDSNQDTGIFYLTALMDDNPAGIGGTDSTSWADNSGLLYRSSLGYRTTAADYYIQINNIDLPVCESINNQLNINNGAPLTGLPSNGENHNGCFVVGTSYNFFKMVKAE